MVPPHVYYQPGMMNNSIPIIVLGKPIWTQKSDRTTHSLQDSFGLTRSRYGAFAIRVNELRHGRRTDEERKSGIDPEDPRAGVN